MLSSNIPRRFPAATGYLFAAAVLTGLGNVLKNVHGGSFRTSLTHTALLLADESAADDSSHVPLAELTESDFSTDQERTAWGTAARRLMAPYPIGGIQLRWALHAGKLRDSAATW